MNVASNGGLDLIGTQAPFTHGCQVLPSTLWTMAIFPYQDDLRTDNLSFTGCNVFPGATCGIFTSTTGTAPNRQFNVEWRAVHFADTTTSVNFEVVFSENQSSFDVIYGATSDSGLDETSGVQASSTGPATTFSCGTATLTNGLKVTYSCQGAAIQLQRPLPPARRVPSTCSSSMPTTVRQLSFSRRSSAEPNVTAVDFFDAQAGTPTLAQLQPYQIVVAFSDFTFLDPDTLGNNLADYVDGGGIVVQSGFSHLGPGKPYGINGRWLSGNYNPYDYSENAVFNAFSLGTHNAGHPLMAGVTALDSDFENVVTPAAGATEVAQDNFGISLVAYRPVSGGHTTVGVTAYVGVDATQSGDWGKVVVNAGNSALLGGGGCGSPTAHAPTGSPACTPIVINGRIETGDPTQTDELDRSGIPQTCPATTTCAIFGDPNPFRYDAYTFTNTTGATQCVTIDTNTACTGNNFIFIAAYLGSFDPNNICTNWIGDAGSSPNPDQAFQVDVDDGQTFVVVVSEVNHSRVSGLPL